MTTMRHYSDSHRRGAVAVLTLILMVAVLACVAFAVDIGYLAMARTQLQRAADAAALAAAWELIEEDSLQGDYTMTNAQTNARQKAVAYAALNGICSKSPNVDANSDNAPDGDVVIATLTSFADRSLSYLFDDPSTFNTVTVRVRRTPNMNQSVPLFFAPVLGQNSVDMQAQATAGVIRAVAGFRAPADGGNLGILPIALDIDTWNDLLDQATADDWTWDPDSETITPGGDGVYEVNLYPQGTGSPGNRGTIDIGSENNSTDDIARQITDGVSPGDLEHHGGKLEFDDNGELFLNGDTGISAGVKDELVHIKGEPKVIPIFREVHSPGDNATYTIVKFVGVRVLDVKLTGTMTAKRVIIQPANVVSDGVIAGPPANEPSFFIYSRPYLIR